jgi:hypothetical protein
MSRFTRAQVRHAVVAELSTGPICAPRLGMLLAAPV